MERGDVRMKHARDKGMRPSSRPKHVRRASVRREPRHDYTTRRPYLETPARPFLMPPEGVLEARAKARIAAATYGALAALYALAWAYGCARWGWGL